MAIKLYLNALLIYFQNWEAAQLKSFLAALTAVNLSQDCNDFTVAVLCPVDKQMTVQQL